MGFTAIGTGRGFRVSNDVSLSPAGAATKVHWRATVRLLGFGLIFRPVLATAMARIGDAAMNGLRTHFSSLQKERPVHTGQTALAA